MPSDAEKLADTEDSTIEVLPRYGNYINGRLTPPVADKYLPTEDPFTGRVWASIGRGTGKDVDDAVDAADRALRTGAWPQLSPSERGRMLWKLGELIVHNAGRLAEIERRDNGKLASEVIAQVRYMGDYFKYYAGLADKIESSVLPTDKKGVFAYTKYEPKGVIAIITPWNSPLTLTSWKLAPALAAGCTAVIKPSEFTSASMLEMAPLFAEAGLPDGVVNVVTGLGPEVGEPLVTHPKVAHVGFTGGNAAGRRIYELAARGLKTVTLRISSSTMPISSRPSKALYREFLQRRARPARPVRACCCSGASTIGSSKSWWRSCAPPNWATPVCPKPKSDRSPRDRSSKRS